MASAQASEDSEHERQGCLAYEVLPCLVLYQTVVGGGVVETRNEWETE